MLLQICLVSKSSGRKITDFVTVVMLENLQKLHTNSASCMSYVQTPVELKSFINETKCLLNAAYEWTP